MTSANKKRAPVDELIEGCKRILGSGEGSDLKVECDGILWTVHSVLLSIQSRFFQAACTGNFKENTTRIIQLHGELPGTVDRMISYLYELNYSDGKVTSTRHGDSHYISPFDTNVKMYAMGEKFGIDGLKQLAKEKFEVAFDSVAPTKLGQFLDVIPEVYNSTPDTDEGLRELAVTLTLTREDSRKDLTSLPEFKSTIIQTPEFALDLILKTVPHVKSGYCHKCKHHVICKADTSCSECNKWLY